MTKIKCPLCKKMLQVKKATPGGKVKCPSCNDIFTYQPTEENAELPPDLLRPEPKSTASAKTESRTRRQETGNGKSHTKPSRMWPYMVVGMLALFGIPIGVIWSFVWLSNDGPRRFLAARDGAALCPHLQEYVSIPGLAALPKTATISVERTPGIREMGQRRPFITGKAVVVDTMREEIHPVHRLLSPGIKAELPEDVETIVWVRRDSEYVGRYVSPGTSTEEQTFHNTTAAARGTCVVTVIHRGQAQIVGEAILLGKDPTETIKVGDRDRPPGSVTTSPPSWTEVAAYLNKLPRH